MTYAEAWRLLGLLARDPSSHVCAAVARWDHPTSREAIVLMDLYDLQHRSKSKKKPKPYPRPWPAERKRYGRSKFTPAETRRILDARR